MRNSEIVGPKNTSDTEISLDDHILERIRPVAEAVGRIAIEWNSLDGSLSRIFVSVTGLNEDLAYAIWNSIENERLRRSVLMAVTKQALSEKMYSETRQQVIDLINQINTVSGDRNGSIHCPFALTIEDGDIRVIPYYFTKNRAALKLKDLDILPELEKRTLKIMDLGVSAHTVLARVKKLELGYP